MIVDDDPHVCKGLQRLFEAAGYFALTLRSGEDLFQALRLILPDCLVLDMHLPGVSGLEVQRQLGKRFPVIAVSGDDEPSLAHKALELGASAFLAKPLESDKLLRIVADCCGY
jgi:FixJ family two-component response regulator